MTKSEAKALNQARAARNMPGGGLGIYARSVSGLHRAGSARTQRELEASIEADGTAAAFIRHASGALIAAPNL